MKKQEKDEDFTIEIKWSLLERIAEFYQFPVAVFLSSVEHFQEAKTERDLFKKKAHEFEKEIKRLVEKYWEIK